MINDLNPFKPGSIRSILLSSSLSMVASKLAARKLTTGWLVVTGVMYMPHNQIANQIAKTLISYMMPPVQQVQKVSQHTANFARNKHLAPAPKSIFTNRLTLHTFEKQYTCVFTGKVTCGDRPCREAAIKIHVESKQNPYITRTVSLQEDGQYELSIVLKEALHENVDWWIVADSPESAAKQVQGRQILMDDSTIYIEEPIHLL